MRKKSKRVIPGFGLSLGVTISILSIVVLIPLASLVIYTAKLSPAEFWETITRPRVLASFRVSLLTAFVASAINAVMGVILAWVLVRYRFPLKQLLNGMIELPFALPTAVAGIALTSLTADTGLVGKWFARFWHFHRIHQSRHYRSADLCGNSLCGACRAAGSGKAGSDL